MVISLLAGINWLNLSFVFIWTFIASLGIPGALLILVSSGAIANNTGELLLIILVGALAAILGDITAYELARRFSLIVRVRLLKFNSFRKQEKRTRKSLKKHQFSLVFFTRFILTELCATVSYISGFEKLDRRKFITAVILGEILYASIFSIAGYIFKQTWNDLVNVINNTVIVVLLIVILYLIIRYGVYRRAKRRVRKAKEKNLIRIKPNKKP